MSVLTIIGLVVAYFLFMPIVHTVDYLLMRIRYFKTNKKRRLLADYLDKEIDCPEDLTYLLGICLWPLFYPVVGVFLLIRAFGRVTIERIVGTYCKTVDFLATKIVGVAVMLTSPEKEIREVAERISKGKSK